MAELSKTAIERIGKEAEMVRIISALSDAGFPVERVNDFGTLAYMVGKGELEGRFVTIKVVLTKELDEEKGTGFDMEGSIREYELKVQAKKEVAEKAAKVKTKKVK